MRFYNTIALLIMLLLVNFQASAQCVLSYSNCPTFAATSDCDGDGYGTLNWTPPTINVSGTCAGLNDSQTGGPLPDSVVEVGAYFVNYTAFAIDITNFSIVAATCAFQAILTPQPDETCNGIDDNCNGLIDEGLTTTYYADVDNDGFGNANNSIQSCTTQVGYTLDTCDCNDSNADVYPGKTEVPNSLDDDCNGLIDDICANPVAVSIVQTSPTEVVLNWNDIPLATNHQVQYRTVGSTTYLPTIGAAISMLTLTELTPGTNYEYRIRTRCNTTYLPYSENRPFTSTTTSGTCAKPAAITAHPISNATVRIFWKHVPTATKYNIRYRPSNSAVWATKLINTPTTNTSLPGLQAGVTYLYQVRSLCAPYTAANWTGFSSVGTFTMPGGVVYSCVSNPFVSQPTSQNYKAPDLQTTEGVTLMPNPNSGEIRIITETAQTMNCRLYDVTGRLVQYWKGVSSGSSLTMTDQNTGFYIMHIEMADGSIIAKSVIKQ